MPLPTSQREPNMAWLQPKRQALQKHELHMMSFCFQFGLFISPIECSPSQLQSLFSAKLATLKNSFIYCSENVHMDRPFAYR